MRLRESFWLQTFTEAARSGRSLIFTFAPEATVDAHFPERVREAIEPFGGSVIFIALNVSREEQERRIADANRLEFGKLRSLDLLRELRDSFEASMRAMPAAEFAIDTQAYNPTAAAERIAAYLAAR